MSYTIEVAKKNFQPNIVVLLFGKYFSISQVDSGLTIDSDKIGVIKGLTIDPITIDLRRVNTTIASYTLTLQDNALVLTKLLSTDASSWFGSQIRIWLGRTTGSFAWSDYFELPKTNLKQLDYKANSYTLTTAENTDKINLGSFNISEVLSIDINSSATTITATTDISKFPASGTLKIDSEYIDYSAKNNATKQFTSCTRATQSSQAVAHTAGATIENVVVITANPLTILLQILISTGGGGTYDVLAQGVGLDHTLIDVTGIETIRDATFSGQQFKFLLYGIDNTLTFIEDEILLPCNLRFTTSATSQISVAVLDQSVFGASIPTINESTTTEQPGWSIDQNLVVNIVNFNYDWDDVTQIYKKTTQATDATSISTYGTRPSFDINSKGIRASLSGATIASANAKRFLNRFSTPTPIIDVKTQMDKSLINVGDKVSLVSTELPTVLGTLSFTNTLEVLSRQVDIMRGQVDFSLAFTSYSGIRACYISPTDLITAVTSQTVFSIASGHGLQWMAGWKLKLWDDTLNAYTSDTDNPILSISTDTITMTNAWSTTLIANRHRIKFSGYNEATTDEHRYGFIAPTSANFDDGSSAYKINF